MKIKDVFNIKNIKNFIEGNYTYFKKELGDLDPHIEEQIKWRLSLCKDDCVPLGKCQGCGMGCPTKKKILTTSSCNYGKRFPNMMNKNDWEIYKKENGIQ